jgi:hypothetical protein
MAKPPVGWVKLSIDGSFGTKEGTAGCGMIPRDDQGNIIFSACRFLPRYVEVVEAKLLACREGLDIALENSHLPIMIESDCIRVISALMEKIADFSLYFNIISDIRLLDNFDRLCKFVKVDRSEVRVSHFLANFARTNHITDVCHRSGPDFVF